MKNPLCFRVLRYLIPFFSVLILISPFTVRPAFAAGVSTSSPDATETAMAVLKAGGNALDAACAAVFALNVTQPYFTGVGGGGFALIERSGKQVFFDFRESAPESVNSKLFYPPNGSQPNPNWDERNTGGKSVGTPGVVAGCGTAMKSYGKLSWKKVIEPAIALARKGFRVSQFFQVELTEQWKRLSPFEFTKSLFQGPEGGPLKKNDILKQPLLAQSLEGIAQDGPESFYTGSLAKKWLAEAQSLGVKITQADLNAFTVQTRELTPFSFGKLHGVTVSAPSGAGLMIAAVLRYLDHYQSTYSVAPASSVERYILDIETKSFFGRLRNQKIADPSKMTFSVNQFLNSRAERDAWKELDKKILSKLVELTKTKVARFPFSPSPGSPTRSALLASVPFGLSMNHTAHVSVLDDSGMAVALTSSVGNIFGSGIVLPKSGFVLNSTLGDFEPEAGHLNSPMPRTRPLSNMSPVLLYEGNSLNRKLIGILGAAGGPLIPSGIVDFIQNYYVHQLDKDKSIRFPRIYSEDASHVTLEKNASPQVIQKLRQIGYEVELVDSVWAVFEGVVRKSLIGNWEAVAETRYDGLGLISN